MKIDKSKIDVKKTGQRVRALRERTRLSRAAFAQKHDIPESTLKYWEYGLAMFSKDSMMKLLNALETEGIRCSPEELLVTQKLDDKKNKLLAREIEFFYQNYPDGIHAFVQDESLAPLLQPKDVVFGVKASIDEADKYFNQLCIVQDEQASYVKILKGTARKGWLLLTGYVNKEYDMIAFEREEITCLAPVVAIKKMRFS
jgi:transcriptional regulator with XRE-family HTH domain